MRIFPSEISERFFWYVLCCKVTVIDCDEGAVNQSVCWRVPSHNDWVVKIIEGGFIIVGGCFLEVVRLRAGPAGVLFVVYSLLALSETFFTITRASWMN